MDGLRLSLIVAGVVLVAIVYFLTARRRRIDREAGSFDRFQAWSDDSRDPLVDDDADHDLSSASSRERASVGTDDFDIIRREPTARRAGAARAEPSRVSEADDETVLNLSTVSASNSRAGPKDGVLEGLEAIADSLRSEKEPPLGALDTMEAAKPPPGHAAASRSRDANASASSAPPRDASQRRRHRAQGELDLGPPPPAQPGETDMVVILNVLARDGERVSGEVLHPALESVGLSYGDMQAYHYYPPRQDGMGEPLFSVLNAVNPGTLDPNDAQRLQTPGVALVMRLPGPKRPLEAFEAMHQIARQLATVLDARLCDSTRSSLTRQAVNHLREQIAEYGRRRRVSG